MVKTTKHRTLKNYMIKMRIEDYLSDNVKEIQKVVKWKCPICWTEHGTKKAAYECLGECRERVVKEIKE